jgi:hypothetical protein
MSRKSLKNASNSATQGALVIVRPSELAKAGTTGIVASGTYEGTEPNKFDETKSDYFVRNSDGTLYIINETKSLKEQLGQLKAYDDAIVEVVYNGKTKTKNGKGWHDFEVFVIGE